MTNPFNKLPHGYLFICSLAIGVYTLMTSSWLGQLNPTALFNGHDISPHQPTQRQAANKSTKLILFWSTHRHQKTWFDFSEDSYDSSYFRNISCPHTDCELSYNRSRLEQADMLLWFYNDPVKWPRVRHRRQYYGHFIWEAPRNTSPTNVVRRFQGHINITLNYRHDADIHVPYGVVAPATGRRGAYEPRVALSAKEKMVVWPVSHCFTFCLREDYVKELSRYVDVDLVGRCGKQKCPKTAPCFENWERTYKFVLAFENNICVDYITEKLYNVLNYELIPVVLGGGNYTRDAPPHSFINARDFNTPKDLAQFLHELAADEERYYSYFQWKSKFKIVDSISVMMCRICELLHDPAHPEYPALKNYTKFWYGDRADMSDVCDNDLILRMRANGGW